MKDNRGEEASVRGTSNDRAGQAGGPSTSDGVFRRGFLRLAGAGAVGLGAAATLPGASAAPTASTSVVAAPGELQSVLNAAASDSGDTTWGGRVVVELEHNQVYKDPPYRVPEPVILNCNGATFRSGGRDVDILFLDSGVDVVGPATINTRPTRPYTNDAIVLSGSRSSSTYSLEGGYHTTNLWGTFRLFGFQPPAGRNRLERGNAVAIRGGPGDGEFITHCYLGDLQINGFNNGVLCRADGYLNDIRMSWVMTNVNRGFYHTGSEEAKIIATRSHMQMGDMETPFRNDTDQMSIRWWGHGEDPQRVNRHIFDGPHMKLFPTSRWNLSRNSVRWAKGTTYHGVGVQRDVSGKPTDAGDYWAGERVYTEDGLYEKNPYQDNGAWIRLAGGSFVP